MDTAPQVPQKSHIKNGRVVLGSRRETGDLDGTKERSNSHGDSRRIMRSFSGKSELEMMPQGSFSPLDPLVCRLVAQDLAVVGQ